MIQQQKDMNNSQKLVKEIADANNGFASHVAQTVLKSGKCSYKQFQILNERASDFLDLDELDNIDITNLKSASFENWNQEQIDRAKRTHLN